MNIVITMKDGTRKEFMHKGRSGGSYTKEVRYEGAFVIVTDEWGSETAIPAADVAEVKTEPTRW
jgi:hypothetical protein